MRTKFVIPAGWSWRDAWLVLRHRCGLLPVKTMTDGVAVGARFCAGPSNPAYASGTNEVPVQRAVAAHLRAGGVFFDVGSNVGFFSIIAGRIVGPGGRVIAFEPVARNAAFSRLNARLNGLGNVQVIERAVGETSGTGRLFLARYSGGAALEEAGKPPDYVGTQTVEVISLDDCIASGRLPRPAMVKVDVEGAEIQVFRGMRNTLQEHRPIVIFEVDAATSEVAAARWQGCQQYLMELGYRITELEDSYPQISWHVRHGLAVPW